MTRRTFMELAGGGIVYAFNLSCGGGDELEPFPTPKPTDHAHRYFVDYTEWLFIHPDGSVTAHTGRTELGQGLTTVLHNIIAQGLELPDDTIRVVMGDTAKCPDDGPTEGSSATRIVGWGHWRACELIRADLVVRAASVLDLPVKRLHYRDGGVEDRKRPERRVEIGELGDGSVRVGGIDPEARSTVGRRIVKQYTDRRTANVNAEAIVTGTLKYTADLFPGECAYGALLLPEYYRHLTSVSVDLHRAKATEGVLDARTAGRTAYVVGESYTAVQRGLAALDGRWTVPERPRELDNEREIRAGAALEKMVEEQGDPEAGFTEADHVLEETYVTQYASQVPIETETAIARVDDGEITVWASTQAPFKIPPRTAKRLKISEDIIRVISMPVGGGFGVKVDTPAPTEAAMMAWRSKRMVKHVYSRAHQFFGRGRFKESTVIDIASGVASDGRLVARTIDLFQDEGFGTTDTYTVPHVRTRLFDTDMPARHGTMRGTSFVQSGFAVESHTDMVAEMVGMDPLRFRKKNVAEPAFRPLLDACAEMIGYGQRELPEHHGVGFGICFHGGRQLGAAAAEVAVDPATGRVRVERMVGAYDIGLVINRNTLDANTRGAMIWGLGFALMEEVQLDGHTAFTRSLDDYRIPRFSDVPPIELAYLDNASRRSSPRGCGELPVIPTVAALCNAVYRAVGIRFHTLPMTPERVLTALRSTEF
jgi:isoquinoline 1-oxidoreductase